MRTNDEYKRIEERVNKIFLNSSLEPFNELPSLEYYKEYLLNSISFPCELTGIEDFGWEEFYLFGPGNKSEYERLKETNPSYTDIFDLVTLDNEIDKRRGIIAVVKRKRDNKKFKIPLSELVPLAKDSKNYELLDDYSVWIVNN